MINRLLKIFISVLFLISYRCYLLIRSLINKNSPSTLVILTYHSISDTQRQNFIRQINMLRRYHTIFPDAEIPLDTGRHFVALTFDDGFECVVEKAIPELLKRNIPATLFIPTGYLGQRPGWITNQESNTINESVMTPEQLLSLPTDFIQIGSHTARHRFLTLLNEEEALAELVDSKKCLEELLHSQIACLSLPYGAYNNNVLALAKRAGYLKVFCSWPLSPLSGSDGFLLGRITASPDDWGLEFWLKIMGAYQWLLLGISMKRKVYNLLKINTSNNYRCKDEMWI